MDRTLTYIKMCEKSEIQKEWKPKDDDFVWHPNEGEEAFGRREFPAEFRIVILSDIQTKSWWLNWLWLPRQDQLQEMIGKDRNIWQLNVAFQDFLKNDFKTSERILFIEGSMEQLWLAFVMKEKYNKIWDGEDWIKE